MPEHIYGYTTQTTKNSPYISGECSCGSCSAFTHYVGCKEVEGVRDWRIADQKCCGQLCTSQDLCVHKDNSMCSIGTDKTGQNPLTHVSWNREAPALKCQFDLAKINTKAQVDNFKDKFGNNSALMSKFCTQKVEECPDKIKGCSRLMSTGDGSDICRAWFQGQSNATKDAMIQSYCIHNNTDDCKCINRANNDVYNAVKPGKIINDGCWFTPCANASKFLVPSNLHNPTCPSNVCDVIYNIVEDRDVDISDITNEVECDFSGHILSPGPGPTPKPGQSTHLYIYLGIGAVVLGVIIFMMTRK